MSSHPTDQGSTPDRGLVAHVVEAQIRPMLRVHGGDIDLLSVSADGTVELEFLGACRACALKQVTYAIGVRERLRRLPGVEAVSVRGVNLSAAALDRVATAYAGHPLSPTPPASR